MEHWTGEYKIGFRGREAKLKEEAKRPQQSKTEIKLVEYLGLGQGRFHLQGV